MKIGFQQTSPLFGKKEENVDKAVAAIQSLNADLVVLPELFNTGYQFTSREEAFALSENVPEGQTTRALMALSREKGVYIVAGLAEQEKGHCYNSSLLVGPQGFIGCYRKLHLFYHEKQWFEPGNRELAVYDIGKARVGIMICFDWFFPEVARDLAVKGADIICHPANLVLPYCPQAMITRCIENRVFAVTANRIGSESRSGETLAFIGTSQIIGAKGEILYRASPDRVEAMVVEIDPAVARDKNVTPENHLLNDRRFQVVSSCT
ncbi:acyltransferase [Candidatus Brocadia sapporoensis]|uniref:Acyltransferase n=1 Tax=Candidatus Brocadia sapporoensis TaxID=392547 RepID=A0A1V6M2K1_9BACT|nr:nitrilase-related carbon-nitrogen hydrolase [Candidatus Brocadia sapporoensis]OQD46546.1 acyltransferase [Candidatus Brocadia sapporoensis]GJQ22720.1 MAG: apolipoprotein N-acyltransferase [Candidatus Brocadia sapporoensis]